MSFILSIAGLAYLTWITFVFIYVCTLKEIRPESWHYAMYNIFCDRQPCTSCKYGLVLMLTPSVLIFIAIIIAIMFAVYCIVCAVRLLAHWVLRPIICGHIPAFNVFQRKYWKNYFSPKEMGEVLDGDAMPLRTKSFMPFSPIFFVFIAWVIYLVVKQSIRMTSGSSSTWEYVTLACVVGGAVLVIGITWLVRKPKTGELWSAFMGKVCRPLAIVNNEDEEE